jgi:TPR repeat protein
MSFLRITTSVVLGAALGAFAALMSGRSPAPRRQAAPALPAAATVVAAASASVEAQARVVPAPPRPDVRAGEDVPLREQPLEATESAVLAAALSCARGEPDDCLRAAEAYEAGRGVEPSPGRARDFRSSAIKRYAEDCTARDPDACHALATFRATGRALAQSVEAAEVLMDRARQACRRRPAPICDKL